MPGGADQGSRPVVAMRAENKTDVTRVILFCDIERPLSSRVNPYCQTRRG